MTTSVSDNTVIIGIIAIGVFFGINYAYDIFNVNVDFDSIIFDILIWIWYIGLLLLISGVVYKIVKWRYAHKG
ncbi:hypothetical protein [Nitrosopumilus sp.]|uniref:hypothetical protein n=1 Tax=Nitrosopumilus sp. TaxID=2024843 RepID=UPI003D0E1BA9